MSNTTVIQLRLSTKQFDLIRNALRLELDNLKDLIDDPAVKAPDRAEARKSFMEVDDLLKRLEQ